MTSKEKIFYTAKEFHDANPFPTCKEYYDEHRELEKKRFNTLKTRKFKNREELDDFLGTLYDIDFHDIDLYYCFLNDEPVFNKYKDFPSFVEDWNFYDSVESFNEEVSRLYKILPK